MKFLLPLAACCAGLAAVARLTPASAATLWCVVQDSSRQTAYVSGLRNIAAPMPSRVRKLGDRFGRVAGANITGITKDAAVCRSFRDRAVAIRAYTDLTTRLQGKGYKISVLGVF